MGYRGIEATECEMNDRGELPEKEDKLICCPELDKENTGEPNFSENSCLYRQQDTEFKLPTCYGGCKGRRPIYNRPKTPISKKTRQRATESRVKEAEAIREKIVELKSQGMSIPDIAFQVNRSKSLVEKKLLEVGLIQNKFVCGFYSKKSQVFRFMDENPQAKL